MADFKIAKARTAIFEGGYANDPADAGGETYKGVSRKANPNWKGWKIVDSYKGAAVFPKALDFDVPLQEAVDELYKAEYWDKVWGDKIKNQKVANDMFDTTVNMGVATSIKLSERQFKLKETGKMSNELLTKLNSVKE